MPSDNVISEEQDRADEAWEKRGEMMSGKKDRYELGLGATVMNDMFSVIRDTETGVSFEAPTACDLLNRQAAQLEVLREWIVDGDGNPYRERKIITQAKHWPQERVELAKARIVALEGK